VVSFTSLAGFCEHCDESSAFFKVRNDFIALATRNALNDSVSNDNTHYQAIFKFSAYGEASSNL
jgi:hypothetical protein